MKNMALHKSDEVSQSDEVEMEEGVQEGAVAEDDQFREKSAPRDEDDYPGRLSWAQLMAQLLHDKQVASGLHVQGIFSFHLQRLANKAVKDMAKGLAAQKDLMGNLLTPELYLPDPDPEEEEQDFEETVEPPALEEDKKKVINMVGRLYGPNRLVFLAIEGVAGIKIRVQSAASTFGNSRHVAPGDKFTLTLCVRDTATRASMRFECAKRDIARLWAVPTAPGEVDEVRLRQMRLARILSGTYDPEEDDIDGAVSAEEEEAKLRAIYEAEMDLPEETGEDKVTLQANVPLPSGDGSVNWAGRVIGPKGRTLKNLRLKTGCRVELKGKGTNKGGDGALHMEIYAIDEPDRATVRLKKCMAEAKKLLVVPQNSEEDLVAKEQRELVGDARTTEEKKEQRKKEYSKIAHDLTKAKESSAAANPAGATKLGLGLEGILGQPPAAFGASPSPLMNSSLRQPSPHDAGGPIRNPGHGKGHRFNPVSAHPSSGGASSLYSGGVGSLMGGGGGMMGGAMGSGSSVALGAGDEEPVVFVYNIGPETTEIDLYGLCGPYGAITKVDIAKHKDGNSRGFGFVTFASFEDGARTVAALDGHQYEKNGYKPLSVSFKTKKTEEKSGGAKAEKKTTSLLQSPGSTPSLMGSAPGAASGGFSGFGSGYSMSGGGGGGGTYAYSSSYPGMDYGQAPASSATGEYQIFVYNIGSDTEELDLYSLCSPYGPVSKVNVVKDKGFAFVTFKDYDAALGAIQYLNGHPYPKNQYKKLQVSFKTDKKAK